MDQKTKFFDLFKRVIEIHVFWPVEFFLDLISLNKKQKWTLRGYRALTWNFENFSIGHESAKSMFLTSGIHFWSIFERNFWKRIFVRLYSNDNNSKILPLSIDVILHKKIKTNFCEVPVSSPAFIWKVGPFWKELLFERIRIVQEFSVNCYHLLWTLVDEVPKFLAVFTRLLTNDFFDRFKNIFSEFSKNFDNCDLSDDIRILLIIFFYESFNTFRDRLGILTIVLPIFMTT